MAKPKYEVRMLEDFGPTWLVQVRKVGIDNWFQLVAQQRFDSWEDGEEFAQKYDRFYLFRD